MREKFVKILSAIVGIVLILILTLSVMGNLHWNVFWVTAAISAIYAHYLLPRLKKQK